MAQKRSREDYLIVGLTGFGENLAFALEDLGHRVLGLDKDREVIQRLSDNLRDVISLDTTDYETMASLELEAFSTAVVALGDDLSEAVLVTLILKELGVRRVVCEAHSDRDRRVLLRVGADEVLTPAIESARTIAYHLTGRAARTQRLRFTNYLAIKWRPPGDLQGELGLLMARYSEDLEVILIAGREITLHPGPETVVQPGDEILVLGPEDAVAGLSDEEASRGD